MKILECKLKVIELGHSLVKHGLIARTWGNISVRVDKDSFVITPSGKAYETLTPDDIVHVNIKDLKHSGAVKPSSEKGIHAAVYDMKPNMNCVIHTHQKYASALSATQLKEVPLEYMVPCATYGLPGTKKLKDNVASALIVAKHAVIMKFHGALTFAITADEALEIAINLEVMSKNYIEKWLRKTDHPVNDALKALNQRTDYNGELTVKDNWVTTPEVVALSHAKMDLKPLLDDFAQLTGTKAKCVEDESHIKSDPVTLVKGKGAYLQGSTDDVTALKIVTEKAAMAYVTASLFGKVRPIPYVERILMRLVYKYKYSKQKGGS